MSYTELGLPESPNEDSNLWSWQRARDGFKHGSIHATKLIGLTALIAAGGMVFSEDLRDAALRFYADQTAEKALLTFIAGTIGSSIVAGVDGSIDALTYGFNPTFKFLHKKAPEEVDPVAKNDLDRFELEETKEDTFDDFEEEAELATAPEIGLRRISPAANIISTTILGAAEGGSIYGLNWLISKLNNLDSPLPTLPPFPITDLIYNTALKMQEFNQLIVNHPSEVIGGGAVLGCGFGLLNALVSRRKSIISEDTQSIGYFG